MRDGFEKTEQWAEWPVWNETWWLLLTKSTPQEEVEKGLDIFDAKSIVVGHPLQSKVSKQYNGKVIGIDVKHPKDYSKSLPNKKSEGLLIENNKYYRVFHNGEKEEI